jgi:CRISPR-associated protein Cas1
MTIVEDLIVSDYGAFVGLKGRRIHVSIPDHPAIDAPLMHLRSVQILTRSASVSASALAACCEAGIPIHFIDPVDGNYATVLSPKLTTVMTSRRCQIQALEQSGGVAIARQISVGKIRSQIVNLRYLARRLDADLAQQFHGAENDLLDCQADMETLRAEQIEEVRAIMMGIEGRGARIYWETLSRIIPPGYTWPGRTGRHATDPVNSLLNYGYGILYGEVQNALVIAGLEPYAGLIHTDRPGKPGLTLDLIEEFRAPIVDRTVIGLITRQFTVENDEHGRMTRETRQAFAGHILSRLEAQGSVNGKRYRLRSIIQLQARLLAAAFRGEARYQSYTGG